MGDTLPVKASAKKAAEAERLAVEIAKRKEQLDHVIVAMSRLTEARAAISAKSAAHATFVSHLDGFYMEVDKLAKGKALFQATDLIVEGTNSIVRDAKAIISGDVYIDRVKEFVPAGENPVYPDILMVLRTIQQANARFTSTLQTRARKVATAIKEAETVRTALDIFIEGGGEVPTKEEIEDPAVSWFGYQDEYGQVDGTPFDFARLDGLNITEYLTSVLTAVDA